MKRNQNKRRSKVAISLLLLSIALGVPVALGSYLLNTASAPVPLTVSGGETTLESSAAVSSRTASASGATSSPLVNGVLYTNGPVEVNWGGVRIPVENTTYAFSSGELISTASDAMGAGAGTVSTAILSLATGTDCGHALRRQRSQKQFQRRVVV